jgi:D-beta-D-heptose 7-phosphate kinase/D-beta-D-heptose 1-phosphate adenosyltransferase
MTRLGVPVAGLFTDASRRTSRKTRVIGASQQVVRIDRETRTPALPAFETAAREFLRDRLPELHALVLSDYGKGVLTKALLRELITQGRARGCPVIVDPKGADYSIYSGATLVTPNRKEAELAVGYSLVRQEDLILAGRTLKESLALPYLLITLGADGMLLFSDDRDHPALHIPTRAREVFDVSGAGDTVVALMALGLAQWGDAVLAAILANIAAGVVVGKIGTAPIFKAELARELGQGGDRMADKIKTPAELRLLLPLLQAQGKKVVFTNGCFDLLHGGHIKFLEESRRLGDVLMVALDSDASVREVKGEGRPVIGEDQRLRILAALTPVDFVTIFTSSQLSKLLSELKPDILTKGSNYPEEQVAGREIVKGYGGEIKLVPITDSVSVSKLIHHIRNGEGV